MEGMWDNRPAVLKRVKKLTCMSALLALILHSENELTRLAGCLLTTCVPRLTRFIFHGQDEAIVHGDEDLLVEVYGRLQRQSWARWRAKVPDLLALLDDSIPASRRRRRRRRFLYFRNATSI